MRNFTEVLDNTPWISEHWKLFGLVSANYLLDGIMFSIAPLMAYIVAQDIAFIVLAANLISEMLGALIFGLLADKYGRRPIFAFVLLLEVLSLIILYFTYNNSIAFLILTSIMTFGIGGEFGAAYAALAEIIPKNHRGKAIMISSNFWNIGATLIAAMFLIYAIYSSDPETQIRLLLLSSLFTAVIIGLMRFGFPESIRWLVIKNRKNEAKSIIKKFIKDENIQYSFELPPDQSICLKDAFEKYPIRLIILAIVTVAQYVTYGMLAYYVPYASGFAFGINEAPKIIFIANLGASIGAFILLPIIDKARRLSLFLSFLGGFITAILVLLFHNFENILMFYSFLFINLMFSEWAWGSISVLQSELFPTGVRSSIVGLLVSLTGIFGAFMVYIEHMLTATQFIICAGLIWLLGLIASSYWYIKGIESARKSVEELT
ncbi:MAG: MFS transporter [Candidatus Verstraetearchaeota archaeon]|nr:MFS transporter [Candidatus Verstraetearchaeota archaeon]